MQQFSVLLIRKDEFATSSSEIIVEMNKGLLLFMFHQSLFKRYCQVKLSFFAYFFSQKTQHKLLVKINTE